MKTNEEDATEEDTKTKELAQEIVDYGLMNCSGLRSILIDVYQAAFRLRESPRNVRQALYLLEMDGTAKKIESNDLWELRVAKKSSQGDSGAEPKAS